MSHAKCRRELVWAEGQAYIAWLKIEPSCPGQKSSQVGQTESRAKSVKPKVEPSQSD